MVITMAEKIKDLEFFLEQIQEDIDNIKQEYSYLNSNLLKDEYAFNYWILSRIFNIDEELIDSSITEYNDKGIDCFVHYEENKELYIIQNKYYKNSNVTRSQVSDFLQSPISALKNNKYKKNQELQNIFNSIKNDPDYKIYFYFFASTNDVSKDIDDLIKSFNENNHNIKCFTNAELFNLSKLYDLYYGKNYSKTVRFNYSLGTPNKGTFLSLRDDYGIDTVYEAYYIATPVYEIYNMLQAAEAKGYAIFDKNIREYLGNNTVNNGIVETLKSKDERKNFIYYNNGITVICEDILSPKTNVGANQLRRLPLVNPQIVNGCQTVSSIKKVLENVRGNLEEEYKNVYVMLKALIIKDPNKEENYTFYNNVVKYTNKQNAVSTKAFSADSDIFYRIQDEFYKRGFVLFVKPSDSNKFKNELTDLTKGELIKKAQKTLNKMDFKVEKYTDICIQLEKLLQVFLAFIKNGYIAFTKKNLVLAQGKELFEDYTSQINSYLTVDNMIKLYYLYKKAEIEQKSSEDKRTPIPYYLIGFFGSLVNNKNNKNIQDYLNFVFSDQEIFNEVYDYFARTCKIYRKKYEKDHQNEGGGDYNFMIKRPIDENCLKEAIEALEDARDWKYIKKIKEELL